MPTYLIPLRPMSKPRPRTGGQFHHAPEYTNWQHAMRNAIVDRYGVPVPLAEPFDVKVTFLLPSRGQADVDNLFAGVMDALQPPGSKGGQGDVRFFPGVLWVDDSWLRSGSFDVEPSEEVGIWITVEPRPEIVWPKKRRKRAM